MKCFGFVLSALALSACQPASDAALCIGLKAPIDRLVAVVLAEGSDNVVIATDGVSARFDAACDP